MRFSLFLTLSLSLSLSLSLCLARWRSRDQFIRKRKKERERKGDFIAFLDRCCLEEGGGEEEEEDSWLAWCWIRVPALPYLTIDYRRHESTNHENKCSYFLNYSSLDSIAVTSRFEYLWQAWPKSRDLLQAHHSPFPRQKTQKGEEKGNLISIQRSKKERKKKKGLDEAGESAERGRRREEEEHI